MNREELAEKVLFMQTDGFCDLVLEDDSVISAEHRQRFADLVRGV